MYVPSHFACQDQAQLLNFIREIPFGILFSSDGRGGGAASHLPFIVEEDAGGPRLLGHFAQANPQWRIGGECLAVFSGAHAYVSPNDYGGGVHVPTWNYAAVHAYGTLELIHEPGAKLALIETLTATFEAGRSPPWTAAELPSGMAEKLLESVAAFRMPIARLEGKWKLSQNKSAEARANAARRLLQSADAGAREIGAWMLRTLSGTAVKWPPAARAPGK